MDAGGRQERGWRRLPVWRDLRSASLLLLAVTLLWASASVAATPADTAATRAYLQAGYELAQALVRNDAASHSSVTTTAERLGRECHGVLAGAPNDDELRPLSESSATPRARGERQRREVQQQTINTEIGLTLGAAIYEPDRAAVEAYAAQIAPLSWSDPRIAPLAHFETTSLEEHLTPPVPDVCTDMRAWAESGYHLLSPASEFEAAHSKVVRPEGSIGSLLKPYEESGEQTLIRQTRALQVKLAKTLVGDLRAYSRLRRALGVPEDRLEKREHPPVLGRGKTSAGGNFVVRHGTPGVLFSLSCRRSVAVEITERSNTSGSSSFETSVCLSRRNAHRQPSSSCGEGIESITAVVPASVWTVRLQLSNERTITSRVIRVPPRYGGPGGVYVQAIRGYSP
jgi:hypothetical protein